VSDKKRPGSLVALSAGPTPNPEVQRLLARASELAATGQIQSIALVYTCEDGSVRNAFHARPDMTVALLGCLEVAKQRIIYHTVELD